MPQISMFISTPCSLQQARMLLVLSSAPRTSSRTVLLRLFLFSLPLTFLRQAWRITRGTKMYELSIGTPGGQVFRTDLTDLTRVLDFLVDYSNRIE